MARETIGQEYRPASFEPLNISARKSYANLGQRKGAKDKSFALIWNLRS